MTIEEARAGLVGQMLVAMGSAPKNRGREMQITMARADEYALAVLDAARDCVVPRSFTTEDADEWDDEALRTQIQELGKEPVKAERS